MATTFKQDMPPKGGYPTINYTRIVPKQRFSGLTVILGGIAAMTFGFAVIAKTNRAKRYNYFSCTLLEEVDDFFDFAGKILRKN